MNVIFGIILTTIGGIMFLIDFFGIFIIYKGITEGKVIDHSEKISYDADNVSTTVYKYTIEYMVNGKKYIYKQKNYTNLCLRNKNVIVKYNLKNPQKCRVKGENAILFIGITLLIMGLMITFCKES